MKLLVTGGAGYIGSHTTHQLVEAGHDVVVLDNFYSGFRWAVPPEATIIHGSVGDQILLERLFEAHRFDGLLHFAAHIEVGESITDPLKYYSNNTVDALTLFRAAVKGGVRNIVLSSTAAVYGEPDSRTPVSEDAAISPINPYGASKAMTERVLQDFAHALKGELRFVILRYFNAAGARRDLKIGQATPRTTHLIKAAAEVALGINEQLVVFGTDYPTQDGTCERDFIHIEDLAQAHLNSLEYLEAGGMSDTFNVGYGSATSVLELLKAFEKTNKVKLAVRYGARRPGDPASLAADSSKIRSKLGWSPRFDDLELICRTAYQWQKKLLERGDSARVISPFLDTTANVV